MTCMSHVAAPDGADLSLPSFEHPSEKGEAAQSAPLACLRNGDLPYLDRMAGRLPRFKTAPQPLGRTDEGAKQPYLPRHPTAPEPEHRPIRELSELFAKRAEKAEQRGKPEAAALELQRAKTCQRVRFNLRNIYIESDALQPARQGSGRLQRFLTSIKSVATGRKTEGPADQETEERKLLREYRSRGLGRCVDLQTFKRLFKECGDAFVRRLFEYLDLDDKGVVLDEEVVAVMVALQKGSLDKKLGFLWGFIASGGDRITRAELSELIRVSATGGGKFSLMDEAVESLVSAFFHHAGCTDCSGLTEEQFKNALTSRKDLTETLILSSLKPSDAPMVGGWRGTCKQLTMRKWWANKAQRFAERLEIEEYTTFFFLLLVILGEIAGFIIGFLENDRHGLFVPLGWSYPVAKGAARSMQVILIVFPFTVARTLITHLRTTFLAAILPLNEHLRVHAHLAMHFFVWALAHSVAHFINGTRIDDPSRYRTLVPPPPLPSPTGMPIPDSPLETSGRARPPALMPVPHWYSLETQVTGLLLFGILLLGYAFVLFKRMFDKARERGCRNKVYLTVLSVVGNFEAFDYTHKLMALSFLVLLIIHPRPGTHQQPMHSTTWLYLVAGTTVYLIERVMRMFRRQLLWKTELLAVKLHPGHGRASVAYRPDVTELRLSVPEWAFEGGHSFKYKPGQYVYLNVPTLSWLEWHPFSLTSSPTDAYLSLHIESAGDWTSSLYSMSRQLLKESAAGAAQQRDAEAMENRLLPARHQASTSAVPRPLFPVRIDGPFGAPAQDYRKFKTLLMVGLGIGATPFASVLRKLVSDFNAAKCHECNTANTKLFKVRKAYFYWVTRQHNHTAALSTTLEEIKKADVGNFLEIYIHFTQAKDDDFQTMLVRMMAALQHEQGGKNAMLGFESTLPCFFGRPEWKQVLTKVALENTAGDDVGVFACGKRKLLADLTRACAAFNEPRSTKVVNPSGTVFKLHREVF